MAITGMSPASAAQGHASRRIGIVADLAEVRQIDAGLRELGWIDGANVRILWKTPEGRLDRAQAIIEEFVRTPVDVLVVFTDAAGSVAVRATRTIPIVMLTTGSVVEDGLIASLARPDRNLTGLSFDAPRELTGKRLGFLKAMAPRTTRVAFLIETIGTRGEHEARATIPETRAAAHALGISVVPVVFESSISALDKALAQALELGADGLLVSEGVMLAVPEHQGRIHAFAARHRLPALHSIVRAADSGGLMAYGLDFPAFIARLPFFIDRILRGTKPSDLPVEQPMRFRLVINRQAARAIDLAVPQSLLVQADRAID